jgi:hypothetical protein
VVIGRGDVVGT